MDEYIVLKLSEKLEYFSITHTKISHKGNKIHVKLLGETTTNAEYINTEYNMIQNTIVLGGCIIKTVGSENIISSC